MSKQAGRLTLESVRLLFKNFSGEKGTYNKSGDRTFSVMIEDVSLADSLASEGWNVRQLNTLEGEEPIWHLPVKVGYEGRYPPQIWMIKPQSNTKTPLEEDTVAMLDFMPIVEADVVINPYHWEVQGDSGTKAYLQTMFVTINETELDLKYADIPEVTVHPRTE